jgi:anaerobic ribonucleoside-triphosphate reductase activating protein
MSLQIQKIHFPVTTLGFGKRLGIWVQGCSIRCEGCINRDTWGFTNHPSVAIDELIAGLRAEIQACDGVTISGGEPLDQAEDMHELLRQLRAQTNEDILMFTGYSREWVEQTYPWVLEVVDVLITDPYDALRGQTKFLRGSDNQRIFLLSELASERYPQDIETQLWDGDRKLDIFIEGQEVFMAGIPRPGDMGRLKILLGEKGLDCKTSDQRT